MASGMNNVFAQASGPMTHSDDTRVMVPVSEVIVHGRGGVEGILQELQDIANACASNRKPDTAGTSREFKGKNEFAALVRRIENMEATVVLRKLFLYAGKCSVMQEIWIADRKNPDATANPHKAYSVVHVHHHAAVERAKDVKQHHLEVVDAMNARHLAATGSGYQEDNPFFETCIELSGKHTLKIFPADKEWRCRKCGQENWQGKLFCRGRCGAVCSGLRPCVAWKWRQQKSRDEGLAQILEYADAAWQWKSRSGKSQSLFRGTEDNSVGETAFVLEELKQKYNASRKRVLPFARIAGKVSSDGSRIVGLCIGVDEYKHTSPLANAVRDADEVNTALGKVPGCYSVVLHNPRTRVDLMKSIKRNVKEVANHHNPPHLFFFYYAGHGIEHKRRMYMVPADATGDDEDDLLSWVPLDDVMQIFRDELDIPVRLQLGKAGAITFLVFLDSCRGCLANSSVVHVDLEPEKPSSVPCKYRIIYSCSRTMFASDGQRGGHSPFATAILDADQGFFAKGVSLQSAITKVSENLNSITKNQCMLTQGTADAIPENFCIQPTPESEPQYAEIGLTSDKGGRGCKELTIYLEDFGFFPDVAARISENMQVSKQLFLLLKADDIDIEDIGLSFLKRQHKKVLQILMNRTADSISSRDSADSDSDASTQATNDVSEASDSEDSIFAGYHLGNADDILAHLKRFFHGLMDENFLGGAHGNLSFCTILWVSFLRGAKYLSSDVRTFENLLFKILDGNGPSEDDLVIRVDSIVGVLGSHKLLCSIRKTIDKFSSRPYVASIAIIDHMVSDLLVDDVDRLETWKVNVVSGWYCSLGATPGVFLERANNYLRQVVGSVKLLECVQTKSCVVFLRMPKLAAHIIFEYLDVGQWKDVSTSKIAGAAEYSSSPVWHGFRLFMSSTHRMSSLTRADVPAQSALPTVRHGLECLARLPARIWELLGPVKTIKDLLYSQTGHSRSRVSAHGKFLIILRVCKLFF